MSRADEIFQQNCRDILENGVWDTDQAVRPRWDDGSPAHTVKKFGIVNRYDLRREFPILTVRRTYFKTCIDELLWIWQQKSNNIHDLRGHIWDSWADETGSIGKAYGYQLGVKHQYPEGEFDQVDRVLYDLRHNPVSLRLFHDLQRLRPHPQRHSEPAVPGYADGQQLERGPVRRPGPHDGPGLRPGGRRAGPRHRRCPYLRPPCPSGGGASAAAGPAPRLVVDPAVTDFYQFTRDSFRLEGYEPLPFDGKIPVAI